ncbi:receptor-like protein 33 [Lotus japonicus]|uniref:receptor-like protein 33 n=1 Tax=Lotus japonicus TaxID=34305 RepID=UPI0025911E46|nr:receptor-like protein 33 [Lotus japonicus]
MSLLLQLKNNLSPFTSERSHKLKTWDPSDDCCAWMGVTCDNKEHVTGLDLSGESISGGFDHSSSLFNLQHLMNLNLAYNDFNSTIPSGFNKLKNLTYLNVSNAGFSGQVPTDISQLTRLVALDLSPGYFFNLTIQSLQKLVQNLTSIRQLYLDGMQIRDDQGQEWCNALLPLRDLQELSMAYCNLRGPLDDSLTRFENLSVIILDGNNFSSPVPETFANFKNLTTLSLRDCNLNGRFPPKIFHIATLTYIDISNNDNLHGFFPDFPLGGSLHTIRVYDTNFSGTLPHSIGNLRHLSELNLRGCQFNGTLPKSLSNLTELIYLDLSPNNFTGPLPSFGMTEKLTYLDLYLSHNSISGNIPSSLFRLPLLEEIDLHDNQFSQLDEFTNGSVSVLSSLDLSNNDLSGPFPEFIFHLGALSYLSLSSNKFHGPLQLNRLLSLINLYDLDISYNNWSDNVDINFESFPRLFYLYMASCNLKAFPSFLRNQSTLFSLDLSKNQIHGVVPNWLWELNLYYLNISSNLLTDLEGPIQKLNNVSSLNYLDLHNNQLQGPIPIFPVNVAYVDYSRNRFSSVIPQDIGDYMSSAIFLTLSDNKFHGNIPDSLCNATCLQLLDLSTNNFTGTIPSCLMTMAKPGNLKVLNLRDNNLKGTIPDMFPASCFLSTLNLRGNQLHGPIPKSLAQCSTLEVLDLGKNHITGGFPCFLKNISTLRVLILRNNRFQGSLGCGQANDEPWKILQIMDIAFDNFSGTLKGKYFKNWETMMHDEEDQYVSNFIHTEFTRGSVYYQDSVTVINKGLQMELVKILNIFTSIDFSSNHFEGPIPEELMDFKALHVLNLSNNALSGEIPSSIGNLKQLESLDISQNSLHGEIPGQLASLTFLSYLNLSFNHLVGKIPTSTQLQSFEASSFEGNDGLHGPPLDVKPDGKKQELLTQPACKRLACTVDWNFLSAELGFSCGIGIVIFPLLFWKQWRIWYWKLLDQILCWIFP